MAALSFHALVIYGIVARRDVARGTELVILASGLIGVALGKDRVLSGRGTVLTALRLVRYVGQCAAVYLLFTEPARSWFAVRATTGELLSDSNAPRG